MKLITTRVVTAEECPWLEGSSVAPAPVPVGSVFYSFHGTTYGVVGYSGIAVTLVDGEYPFTELPRNAVRPT